MSAMKKQMEVISLVDCDDSDCSEKRNNKPSGKRRFPFAVEASASTTTTATHKKRAPSTATASSSSSHNRPPIRPWQPFYLTPVPSLSHTHAHNERCLGFADLLSAEEHNPLQHVVLMNYMVDLHWMAQQAPQLLGCQSVLCLHGSAVDPTFHVDNWTTAKVDLGMERYGTHHSKFGLLFYRDGLRIFITTANFIPEDFTFRTQASFVQDLPRKQPGASNASSTAADAAVGLAFEQEFVDYLQRVRTTSSASHRTLQTAIERMKEYDFSSIQVSLLPSVPGRHTGQNMRKWGLGKLVKELEEAGELWGESTQQAQRERERTRLCMQFSSVGSMGKDARLVHDYARRMLCSSRFPAAHLSSLKIDVVWPTAQCVRDSLQGYESGNSLPCAAKNILDLSTLQRTSSKRLGLEHVLAGFRVLLRRWDGSVAGRERATPHMKCYFKYSLPHTNEHLKEHTHHASTAVAAPPELHWFALTSSNLSQAAWGVFQTSDSQLYIKSYELGVLFLPQRMRTFGRTFSCTPSHPILGLCGSDEEIGNATTGMVKFIAEMNGTVRRDESDGNVTIVPLPVPFVVPPVSYAADDQPWVWDIPFPEPDCLGRRRSTE